MTSDDASETDITAVAGERLDVVLRPGVVFGTRYALEERIITGGAGELFRAFDLRLQRRVALKVLVRDDAEAGSQARPSGRNISEAEFAAVLQKARAAAALDHPNLVAIHDVGVRDGIPFIATEYIDGQPLRALIGSAVPFDTQLAWMIAVARGLAAAHDKGLLHDDLKLENIIIGYDTAVVKVVNFGIARAPESRRDEPPGDVFDGRDDQFAWGAVAYELFAGHRPPPDAPPLANVPAAIARIVARTLSEQAEARYPSMSDVVAALVEAAPGAGLAPFARAGTSPRRPTWRSPRTWIPMVAAIVAIGGTFAMCTRESRTSPSAATASAKATATDMPVSALPLSPSCNKTAEIRYHQGLVWQREATWELARPAFEQGAAADPACPEVQLQLLITGYFRYSVTKEREQFRRVISMRDALSDRDRALLDAWTPLVASEPANREEAARRFDAAVERYPRDAQMLALAAMIHGFLALDVAQLERCVTLARRAIAVDPKYGEALQIMAGALLRLGHDDEAMKAVDQCMAVAPGSGECLLERIRILSLRGECSEAVAASRQWISNVPTSSGAYRHLASTLASEGASVEAVETALQQWHANTQGEERESTYIYHRASLAAFSGDFVAMEQLAKELATRVEESATLFDHARAASMQVELFTETGRPAQAAEIAAQFLRRKDAWTEGFSITTPYEPAMFGVLLREGKITRQRWEELTETWEKNAVAILSKQQAWGLRWGGALNPFYWQNQSDARELATTAWAVRPPSLPQGRSHEQPLSLGLLADAYQGRIALAMGSYEEAAPLFEPLTRSCHVLEQPFVIMRGHQWMGEAMERIGDNDAACKEYGIVLEHWDQAKPHSVTATAARKRSQVLGCHLR